MFVADVGRVRGLNARSLDRCRRSWTMPFMNARGIRTAWYLGCGSLRFLALGDVARPCMYTREKERDRETLWGSVV